MASRYIIPSAGASGGGLVGGDGFNSAVECDGWIEREGFNCVFFTTLPRF